MHRDLRAAAVGRRHRPLHQPMGQDQGQRPVSRSIKSRFFFAFHGKTSFLQANLALYCLQFQTKPHSNTDIDELIVSFQTDSVF